MATLNHLLAAFMRTANIIDNEQRDSFLAIITDIMYRSVIIVERGTVDRDKGPAAQAQGTLVTLSTHESRSSFEYHGLVVSR